MEEQKASLLDQRRYWVGFFVLLSLLLIVGGFFFYRTEADRIRLEKYHELKIISALKGSQIGEWRKDRLADISRDLQSPFLTEAVNIFCRNSGNGRLKEKLRLQLRAYLEHAVYADVLLVAPDGRRIIFSTSEQPEPVEPEETLAIRQSVRSGVPVLSDLYRAKNGKIYMDPIGAIKGADGKAIAVLAFRTDAATFLYPLIESWPTPSRTAETLLVGRDGSDVLFLNTLRHMSGTALRLRLPLTGTDMPAVQAVLGKQGMYLGKDYRGKQVLADLRPITESPWFMVAKVNAHEILAEARFRAGVITCTVLLLIGCAAAVTAYIFRHRQAGLYRSLYHLERTERESQELFRTTLYSIGDGVITTDALGLIRHMNLVAEELTGQNEADAQGKPLEEVFRIINEKSRRVVENPVERVLREGRVVGLANHTLLIARDGAERPIADSGAPIRDERGVIMGVVLVFRDQTRERTLERTLQESEEKYREFFTTSRDCVFISRPYGQWIDCNDAALELFGYESRNEFLEAPVAGFYENPEERAPLHRLIQEKGHVKEHPLRLKQKDGTIMDTLVTAAAIKAEDGSVKAFVGTIRNVSEQKRIQEALRQSEEKYRRLFDDAVLGVFQSTREGKIIANNPAHARMFGYSSPEELIALVSDAARDLYADPAARPPIMEMIERAEGPVQVENLYRRKDGSTFIGNLHAWPARNDKGEQIIEGFVEDITARKLAEDGLYEHKARLDLALRSARMGAWSWDGAQNQRDFDEQTCRLMGIDPTVFTGVAEDFFCTIHPDDRERVKSAMAATVEQSEPYESDYRVVWPDGTVHYLAARGQPFCDDTGKPLNIYGILWDITSRKVEEETVKASLKEKEILLKEIHHRVKNNLQVMSSLLNLQAHHLNDPQARNALRMSMDRIKTMALIHDRLYRSEALSRIYFPGYVGDLAHDLVSTYSMGKAITLNMDVDPVWFNIDVAIPLGLIMNELLSNALKHAFRGAREGVISIALAREDGRMALTITDSGIGFPEGIDFRNTASMGMQLVVTLVEQLDGAIELMNSKGTEFKILFNPEI
ncbi:MAG TPA: PAS domain S-box protein [Syntrophorhabdaceae bacterium]|jgi:PAS domain S-box-containing protein